MQPSNLQHKLRILLSLSFSLLVPWQSFAESPANRSFTLASMDSRGASTKNLSNQHPLEPILLWARENEKRIAREVRDYTCLMVKRTRVDGELQARHCLFAKVRHRKVVDGKLVTPFSLYLKVLRPHKIKDREVLYIENANNGEILVRNGGRWLSSMTVSLDPHGTMAMRGNRYPVTEFGVYRLVERLIEIGQREVQFDDCVVNVDDHVTLNDQVCTKVHVTHREPANHFDFHQANLFIDNKLRLPVRFESYDWPKEGEESPVLMEEYSYHRLQLNVGLTDNDFDRDNPDYGFSG